MQPPVPHRIRSGATRRKVATMTELSMDKFTDTVINLMGPKTSPRVREVMTAWSATCTTSRAK